MKSSFNTWINVNIRLAILSSCALLFPSTILAAPIEIDTPDAHIVVMRALDSWSGDESASEDSLTEVAKHRGGFILASEKGPRFDTLGYPMLFGFNSESEGNPVVHGVIQALKPFDFKLHQDATNFRVENAATFEPDKFVKFAKYQRDLFKSLVISEGNPATLHSSVSARKFFSGILALGTVAIVGEKYGALGQETILNSGIPGDVYQFSSSGRAALTPLDTPDFKSASYKSIDVRRVIQGNNERVGQVIIAYKTDKTEAVENDALIKAIVSLTGADTTVEAIKQARDEDLSKRQAIWNTCVSEGKCKND